MSTTVFEPGAIVRLTEDLPRRNEFVRAHRKGEELRVEERIPECDEGPEFYYLSTNLGMNDVDARPEQLELVMTAEQASARKVPSDTEILQSLRLPESDLVDIDEADRVSAAAINTRGEKVAVRECYGMTEDGLQVAFTVAILNVYQGDDSL